MREKRKKHLAIDPRSGLLMIILANVISFSQNSLWLEFGLIGYLAVLFFICGKIKAGVKWAVIYVAVYLIQCYLLPISPKIIAVAFTIFLSITRRIFPCLMVGGLIIATISLRYFIVGLRKLRFPNKLIITIAVTLRYFPAIREEIGHIRDAMKLRKVRGLQKVEAVMVPLMICASNTAEELSAAAVTRGIDNPVKKTTTVNLKFGLLDMLSILIIVGFTVAAFIL